MSIFPAMVIITQNELRSYRVIGGILLCLICVLRPPRGTRDNSPFGQET